MAAGDILSVVIGADGWYADVTIEGVTAGGAYSFGLGANSDPASGAPKVTFTVVSLGFDTTGAPTTVTRTVYGTKQARKPYPNDATNQETANTGPPASTTVRVALSDYIYAKDTTGAGNSGTAPTVTIGAGFYTGTVANNAATGFAVTNSSTFAYPKVVGNWTWPGYDKLGATFTLRATAFHSSAAAGKPAQCVKFTATDAEANTATTTVAAPSVDAAMGDPVPVVEYVGTLSATTLTQGSVVTCNFVAYPRVGDTAACLDTSLGTAQPTPLYGPITAVCDKTGAYAPSAVVVDVVAGNDATGAVTAAFDSASPPAAFATMAAAFNALRTYNNTNYARNNCGGSVMYLKEGTHPWVNGSIVAGTTPDAWLTVTKFPTATRGNVIIGNQVGGQNLGTRMKLSNIKYTGQSNIGNISGASHLLMDNCEIDCPPGSVALYEIAVLYFTRCLVTNLDQGFHPFSNVNSPPGLIRGNTVVAMGRQILAYTLIGNALLASVPIYDFYSGMLSPESVNTVVAYNKIVGTPGANTTLMLRQGTADAHGVAVIQNLIEITTNSSLPAFQCAADLTTLTPVNNALIWHNVVVGARTSLAYNEVGATLAVRLGWSVRNNIFDDVNVKSDTFPTADTARVGNWSTLYGCGCSGNLHAEIALGVGAPGAFLFEMPGVKSYQPVASGQPPAGPANVIGFIGFKDRRSYNGSTNGAGGGDYHLTGGSPAIALQHEYVLPFDLAGDPRAATGASGAYASVTVVPLGPVTGTGQLYPLSGTKRYTLGPITGSGVVTALIGTKLARLPVIITGPGMMWPLVASFPRRAGLMPLVRNTLYPVPTAREVRVRLVAPVGWFTRSDGPREVLTHWRCTVGDDGVWSVEVPANADYDISGTWYLVEEPGAAHAMVVPEAAGPHELHDLTVDMPGGR